MVARLLLRVKSEDLEYVFDQDNFTAFEDFFQDNGCQTECIPGGFSVPPFELNETEYEYEYEYEGGDDKEGSGLGEYKLILISAGGVAVFGLLAAVTGCFIYKYKCRKSPNPLEVVQDI